MKRVLVLALLSSFACNTVTATTTLEDCAKMLVCPVVCAMAKKATSHDVKRGLSDNPANYLASQLADASVQTLEQRAVAYVVNQSVDSDVKNFVYDTVVTAGVTVADDVLGLSKSNDTVNSLVNDNKFSRFLVLALATAAAKNVLAKVQAQLAQ